MRHSKAGRKLGRTAAHRKATMSALSASLIKHHRITTTLVKAKELRRYVEPLITKAKVDTTHHRRLTFAFLQDKQAVKVLFDEVAPIVGDRPGGYTRIIKIDSRRMDGADMAMIELVDYNDVPPEKGGAAKKKTRRSSGKTRRKSTRGKAESTQSAKVADESKKEKKEAPKTADTKAEKTEAVKEADQKTTVESKSSQSETETKTEAKTKSVAKPKSKSSTASKSSAAAKSKAKSSTGSKSKTAKKSTDKKDSGKKE